MKEAMPPTLAGPRLAPRSGTAKQLVVFLHGYGADGNDLIEIGRQWQRWLPDAAFVSPHAPEPCSGAPMGRQWFPLTFRDPDERWRGVNHAGPALDAFLDAELARHGLDAAKLALVGFSQGTMMALHVGLRRERAPAAIIGYSGMVVADEGGGQESLKGQVRSKPPILLLHGDHDDIIPVDALFLSADALAAADVPVQWHLSRGIAHGIDGEGLRQGGLFLTRAFGLPYPAA
jgi:phospholipase/carboxylesterase